MNEFGIVVSRYYEDLKWIENIKSNVDIYIYNRQGSSPNMGVPNAVAWAKLKDHNDDCGGLDLAKCKDMGMSIELINIPDDPGFEASTYAYHCHSRYESLNDYTVFIQAHPEIYVRDVMNKLNNPEQIKHTTYVKNSPEQLSPAIPQILSDTIDFEPFCDQLGTLYTTEDYQWSLYRNNFSNIPWLSFCKDMPGSTVDGNGNWCPPSSWSFGAGNQFVVSKKRVHRHPAAFYKELQHFINTYMDPNGDSRPSWQQLNQGPNIMEGIWRFVF